MFNVSRFRRSGVLSQVLGISAFVAILFAAGCTTNGKSQLPTTPTLTAAVAGVGNVKPGQTGASYSITVSNAAGAAATSGMITVTDPPTNFTVTGISGTGWTCTLATLTCTRSDVLPAGQSYPPIVVVGNVTGSAGQSISVPITISGGGLTTTVTSSPSIAIVSAPTITSANAATFTVGTAGTFTVTASGSPAPTFSETGALPAGVTLNTMSGVLSGTAAAGSGGTYPITITAQNGVTPNATQSFTLTVDQAPAITSANSTGFVVGAAGTFAVTATGFPASTLSETGTLPTGVTFNTVTGALSGTPASGQQGSYPIMFTAHNGIGADFVQNFTLTVGLAPAITSLNNATFTVGASGTFTVTATGFPAPTFSETGTLPAGVSLSSAGVLSGTPGAATGKAYSITITAQNGISPNASQTFTLTVDQAPAITSGNSATFAVGTAGTFTVAASGFPAPTFGESGPLPSGVSLNTTTGVLSGTPATGTQGSYPITITAQNGVTPNATQSFTLTVGLSPAITSANNATFTVGTSGTFTVTAAGFPAPTFSETGTLPTGVTLNSTTGVLSGTPGPGTGKTYPISITAQNGVTPNATQNFTLTVDEAPSIISSNNATFTVGTFGSFTEMTTGFPHPGLGCCNQALPIGVSFLDNGNGTGTLSGTPQPGSSGVYSLRFTAINNVGSNASQIFTLTVDSAPAITSGTNATFTVGTPATFTVVATGLPAPTFSETGALPSGVTLNSTTGVLSGTPGSGTGGAYPITITAQNGVSPNATQAFTLTVDQAPAITSQNNAIFAVGSASSFTVMASGFPAPTFSETGTLPTGVSFNTTTGVLSGTPASGTQTGSPYLITFTAQNGVGTNGTQNFTLTVSFTAPPSFTSSNNTTFAVGSAGSFTVTASGSPAPTFSESGTLPAGVSLNTTTGALSGTPAANTGGTYPITITAHNGIGADATQSFTLTVDQAPVITSGNSTTFSVGSNGTFTVKATGFPVPTFSETGALPAGVTLNSTTGVLSGTPGAGTQGSYPITITAQNGTAPNATQGFTLTVNLAPVITSANNTTFAVGVGGTFTVTATGSPAPTFSETGALPSGVTLNSTTGVLSGTPAAGTGGSYPITITAQNGSTPNGTQSFTLTVDQAPAIISATSANATAGVAGSFNVTTTGFPLPTLSETATLPTGVSFTNNGNGTGTLSWTTAITVGSDPLSFTASNGIGTDATQSFTLIVTNNSGQISGQISLNNTCGGSVTLPTFTVTINTTPTPQSVQTDTNGNYSFTSIPNGTYKITPSISGAASSVFYPANIPGVVVNSGSVSGENFNAVVGYNVSGTVSYSGSQTGQTYLYLQNNSCGGYGAQGTSITQATLSTGSGAYTIHSVPPGNYTLYAWMDSTGVTSGTKYPGAQGQQNTNDPTGSTSNVSVTTASVTGVGVTMTSPTYSTPSSNPAIQVFPSAGGVAIFYQPSTFRTTNGNKVEDANEYVVQWAVPSGPNDSAGNPTCPLGGGTGGGQFATVAGSHTFYAMGAHGGTVWILNNTMAGAGTFTTGQSYCFQARSFNTLATTQHPTGWSNYNVDSLGNVVPVTIVANGAALCTSNCTTVSGTVTIPSGVTPVSGAPLYVGFYQQSASSNGPPTALYATEISPGSGGAKSYSITIPSGSNYYIFGILDQNNDGQIDAGDVTDTNNNNNAPAVTLSGSATTVNDNSLPATNSVATVQTQYSSCGTNCSNYNLNLQVREGNKLPVAVTLYSGPNLLNPVDMGQCSGCGTVQFQYSASLPGGVPSVNDTYKFTVTYSDGSVDQGSAGTINGKVTAFGITGAVVGASDVPTNLSPSGTSSTSTTPNFTWTFPSNPSNYTYSFYLQQNNCSGNCTIWQIPSQNSNSNGFSYLQTETSPGATTGQIMWGTDPTGATNSPSVPALTAGATYFWSISVQDANSNQAQVSVNYAP
jgi:hypothetical protein